MQLDLILTNQGLSSLAEGGYNLQLNNDNMKVVSFAQNSVSAKGSEKQGQSKQRLNKDGSIPLKPMAAREESLLSVIVQMRDVAPVEQSLLQQQSTSEMTLDLKLLGLKRGTQNGQEISVAISQDQGGKAAPKV